VPVEETGSFPLQTMIALGRRRMRASIVRSPLAVFAVHRRFTDSRTTFPDRPQSASNESGIPESRSTEDLHLLPSGPTLGTLGVASGRPNGRLRRNRLLCPTCAAPTQNPVKSADLDQIEGALQGRQRHRTRKGKGIPFGRDRRHSYPAAVSGARLLAASISAERILVVLTLLYLVLTLL
jgi:hypothetical protein